jgi:UDP-GlcNAc:undecaprenyl-phosphate GlcNAc-1-phosphate transferase
VRPTITQLTIAFAAALVAALLLTPLCRRLARRTGRVASPSGDRWHRRPTALLGGIAIVIPTLAGGLLLRPDPTLLVLLAAGALMATVGLVDDLYSLKAYTKLVAQAVVASILLFFDFRLGWTESMVGDAMLTFFWIVGVTNAFNLLDNMDGLCAGTAILAGAFLLPSVLASGSAAPALFLAVLMGATAGFLVFNVHPASIFMGDTGSLFLGLNLAALTLVATPDAIGQSGLLSVVAVPVLPLLVPIFDTTLVTVVRILSGRSPSQGGRDHTSHRLVAVGFSEPRAVAMLWALAAMGGTVSLLLRTPQPGSGTVFVAGLLLAVIIFGVYLARVRVYDDAASARLGGGLTPVVVNFMYKQRVAEVLLDICLIPLAYYVAYALRFEGSLFAQNSPLFIESLPVVMAAQLLALQFVGGYRGTWRHFGMMDAVVFLKGVLIGTVAAEMVILYAYRFQSYSRTVFVIYAVVLLLLLCMTRASFRLVSEFALRRRNAGRRVVVYGVSGANLQAIRDGLGTNDPVKIVGFIDDDPVQHRTRVGGYSVLGDYHELCRLVDRREVDCVLINDLPLAADRFDDLALVCGRQDVELLRLRVDVRAMDAAS